MPFTIAVISDIHYAPSTPHPARMGEWGSVLLTRAVQRLRRHIKPDLVLLLGDCIDLPEGLDASAQLRELRQIMDLLPCPWLAIPGNHDPAPERFYDVFPRPAERVDFGDVRVLPFLDPEEPGYNARRLDVDVARLRAARSDGFAGTVVAVQHVALYPAFLQHRLKYSYTNLDDVLRAAAAGGVDLCIGGHSHINTGIVQHGRTAFLAVDALCERPFGYTLITIDDHGDGSGPSITSRNETLSVPTAYGLVDYHSHTQFAYCSENMHTTRSPQLAELMGLRAMALTEHSGQLYFPVERYWNGDFAEGGIASAQPEHSRMASYFQATDAVRSERLLVGLEVDADLEGRLVLRPEDAARLQIKVGAVHVLREGRKPSPVDGRAFAEEFKIVTERLCRTGIHVLAHPFRIFQRKKLTPPPELFPWLAGVLRHSGVAAEINFHTNEPEPAFFQICMEMGVPISFGSDAHNLYEVGEFYPHLALLRRIGVSGDMERVMWRGLGIEG